LLAADLKVVLTVDSSGAETVQTITTHYTVAGAGDDAGGTVTMLTAPATGETLSIINDPAQTQGTDLAENDSLPAESLESMADRLTLIAQRFQDLLDRSVKLSDGATGVTLDLPSPVAGQAIGWDAAGTALANIAQTGTITISTFGEALLDDADAATARTTMDVSQAINSLAELTTPAVNDMVPIRDVSGTPADKKVSVANLLNALGGEPRAINVGLTAALTAVAADSIRVVGQGGSALSATNPIYVWIEDHATPGQLVLKTLIAHAIQDLTAAHWGLDTLGDVTDLVIRAYLINDTGTIKVGFGIKGGLKSITNTDTSTAPGSITSGEKILVNTALNAGTWPALEIGWFHSNFDDTGGSSENLHVVQTGVNDLNIGPKPKLSTLGQQLSASSGAFSTSSGSFVSITNLSVTIKCSGRPIMLLLVPDGQTSLVSYVGCYVSGSGTTGATASFGFWREASQISMQTVYLQITSNNSIKASYVPCGSISFVDTPAPGVYTYELKAVVVGAGSPEARAHYVKLLAYEL
jgi:hypothetical protein